MIYIDIQIHGYRKGHQLLASSIVLSKDDQSTIDRLSDIAGPLRPKEEFSPYLSGYPLPSGDYYVLAKTWQDFNVSRAGCVRTKSLLIDSRIWASGKNIISIINLLNAANFPFDSDAVQIELDDEKDFTIPYVSRSNFNELLEALFLEESKPVVLFDSPTPELIATRLVTALWPSVRREFSFSTFALSPRKLGGRDFDLVFSFSNAKSKFSDWAGRRVDAKIEQAERHRWTKILVNRVFENTMPRLLSEHDIALLDCYHIGSFSNLRIALLWNELFEKLSDSPTVVLGLLDIANSGMVNNIEAIRVLDPRFVEVTKKVESELLPDEAWEFCYALIIKLQSGKLSYSNHTIHTANELVTTLTTKAPNGVLKLLQKSELRDIAYRFMPNIVRGLNNGVVSQVKQVLANIPADIYIYIIMQGDYLTSLALADNELLEKTADCLFSVDKELSDSACIVLLPFLIEDCHATVAIPIIRQLDSKSVTEQFYRLGDVNDFKSYKLSSAIILRAKEVNVLLDIRNILVLHSETETTKQLLALTLEPIRNDVLWLLDESRLSKEMFEIQILNVLRRASDKEIVKLLSEKNIGNHLVSRLPDGAIDLFNRMAFFNEIPVGLHRDIILTVSAKLNDSKKFKLAKHVLVKFLHNRFDGDEVLFLSNLLEIIGGQISAKMVIHEGLNRNIRADIASRNLEVFNKVSSVARLYFLEEIDEISEILRSRLVLDLTESAYDAYASIIIDAQKVISRVTLVSAASRLMPSLFRARHEPVSTLVAALFPIVYEELARSHDVPELMKFLFFIDWDRCKTARNELVYTFMSSTWRPGDLALTACRCGELAKILKTVAQSHNGDKYLTRIEKDLNHLDDTDKIVVQNLIADLLLDQR